MTLDEMLTRVAVLDDPPDWELIAVLIDDLEDTDAALALQHLVSHQRWPVWGETCVGWFFGREAVFHARSHALQPQWSRGVVSPRGSDDEETPVYFMHRAARPRAARIVAALRWFVDRFREGARLLTTDEIIEAIAALDVLSDGCWERIDELALGVADALTLRALQHLTSYQRWPERGDHGAWWRIAFSLRAQRIGDIGPRLVECSLLPASWSSIASTRSFADRVGALRWFIQRYKEGCR